MSDDTRYDGGVHLDDNRRINVATEHGTIDLTVTRTDDEGNLTDFVWVPMTPEQLAALCEEGAECVIAAKNFHWATVATLRAQTNGVTPHELDGDADGEA